MANGGGEVKGDLGFVAIYYVMAEDFARVYKP